MKIINDGFDHIEFACKDITEHQAMWKRMGFKSVGERHLPQKGTRSALMQQGRSRVLLTQPDGSPAGQSGRVGEFLKAHGDGVCMMAIAVESAKEAYEGTTGRGGRSALPLERWESPVGTVTKAEIFTPCDLRFAFIERNSDANLKKPALFDEGFEVSELESESPRGIQTIDHLTNNVGMGDTPEWVKFYTKVMGFQSTRHFDISTGKTGLISDVIEDSTRKFKVPINEATEPESQVQEFYDRFHGTGVQHIAFLTGDILSTVPGLMNDGFKFLAVPHTYYEAVPKRGFPYKEDLEKLEKSQILIDGDDKGYLLQIFTDELVGPAFFEYIQRKGNEGFGEGNFQALFEAIERDQMRRGVLN